MPGQIFEDHEEGPVTVMAAPITSHICSILESNIEFPRVSDTNNHCIYAQYGEIRRWPIYVDYTKFFQFTQRSTYKTVEVRALAYA